MRKLVIIGASGHGKVVADIAQKNGYNEILFLDDNDDLTQCGTFSVMGKVKDYSLYADADFVVAIGNAGIRQNIQSRLQQEHYNIATLIHPGAVIADTVTIGRGTVIMAGVVINPETQIGEGCIINTCSSIDHDCVIDNYVHISVGSHLAGTVMIGEKTWIGAGTTVINNIKICEECMIGAGAVVVKDIVEPGIYIGVPAKSRGEKTKPVSFGKGTMTME